VSDIAIVLWEQDSDTDCYAGILPIFSVTSSDNWEYCPNDEGTEHPKRRNIAIKAQFCIPNFISWILFSFSTAKSYK
jgi:hypothetical protein